MHFEYDSQGDLSRYLVRHGPEIERILRGMQEAHTLVTLHGDNGRDFVLTAITGIEADGSAVLLACGPNAAQNEAIFGSVEVAATATHEQVRVQFVTPPAERAVREGECVFRLRMPGQLLRLQRREYYRLITSLTQPVKCLFGSGEAALEALVTDISVGGVGVLYHPGSFRLCTGAVYEGCRLSIPGAGDYLISVKACNAYEETMRNGLVALRAGCQFVRLPAAVETEIQRYIYKVERERRARLL